MGHAVTIRSTGLLARRLAVAGVVLTSTAALLLSVAPGTAGAAGNADCPAGTTGYKIEPVTGGPHLLGNHTVTLTLTGTSTFVWTSSAPVHTVIVKGGSLDAIVTAVGGALTGTGTAPASPSGQPQLAGLSNVTFCYANAVNSPSPSATPSATSSASPSATPSASPSASASATPSASPSPSATASPSPSATASPSPSPSASPAGSPVATGTPAASVAPAVTTSSASPTGAPATGATPSAVPSLIGGTQDDGATGGGGVVVTQAPAPSPTPVVVARTVGGVGSPLPATGPVPAAPAGGDVREDSVVQPAALPFTGVALPALLLFGLALLTGGVALAAAARYRPTHALPGLWSL